MNKNVFAGIFAGVLAVGLLLGPSLSGITPTVDAQAPPQGTVKPVLLVAKKSWSTLLQTTRFIRAELNTMP